MKLRDYRRRQQLTLAELGRRIGVSEGAVSRYESGSRIPDRATMARIARVTTGLVVPNDFFEMSQDGPGRLPERKTAR
ncbi:MAG: helix-turn-helix transcriptional regulator [Alphaproteobacteria bacterium]